MRHSEDYSAISNWTVRDQAHDLEIPRLVLTLADHGLRIAEIENLMKQALIDRLKTIETDD
jgi:hypothetical protein